MWGRGVLPTALPALFSSTLRLALSVYLRQCGAAGSASGQTACPVHPTLCQSQSHHSHASPLCPSCSSLTLLPVWMNVYSLSPWCWFPCRLIFCQFWLWEEAQCVYLCRQLGSPIFQLLSPLSNPLSHTSQGYTLKFKRHSFKPLKHSYVCSVLIETTGIKLAQGKI